VIFVLIKTTRKTKATKSLKRKTERKRKRWFFSIDTKNALTLLKRQSIFQFI